MASVFRICPDTPTGLAAGLMAGGSLTVGQTYYYRIAAVKWNDANRTLISYSQATSEVSATPTTGNQIIRLTWDAVAGADGYLIQRTTSPGSYPLFGTNQFWVGLPYYPGVFDGTQFDDPDGVKMDGYNLDLDNSHAIFQISGGGTMTMADLITAWVSGGWSEIASIMGDWFLNEGSDTHGLFTHLPLLIRGSIWVDANTTFDISGHTTLMFVCGGLRCEDTANLDQSRSADIPVISYMAPLRFAFTSNKVNYTPYPIQPGIYCASPKYIYNLVIKRTNYSQNWGAYYAYVNNFGIGGQGKFFNPLIDVQQTEEIGAGVNLDGAVFCGTFPNDKSLSNIISRATAYLRTANTKFTNIIQNATIYWGRVPGIQLLDSTFSGATGYPYHGLDSNGVVGNTMVVGHTFNLMVSAGESPLEGAQVTLTDQQGDNALWADSQATFSSALNDTDDTSSLTVSDGSKFEAGDVIRLENYAEAMLVTAVAGNVLTVTRGHWGTTKRATSTNGDCLKVLKSLAYLETDADGKISTTVQNRELARTDTLYHTGYEDDLINDGFLARNNLTPHTLTISKEAYQDYQDVLVIDRRMELEVALSPVPPPVYVPVPSGEVDITLAAAAPLGLALEADSIKVQLNEE